MATTPTTNKNEKTASPASTARETYETVKDSIKEEAGRALAGAKQHAESFAEAQKDTGVDYLSSVTSAIDSGRRKLEKDGYDGSAALVSQASDAMKGFAQSMKKRDPMDLLHDVEDFARERPALFYGAALFAGFAAARFLRTDPVEEEPAPPPSKKRKAKSASTKRTAASARSTTRTTKSAATKGGAKKTGSTGASRRRAAGTAKRGSRNAG